MPAPDPPAAAPPAGHDADLAAAWSRLRAAANRRVRANPGAHLLVGAGEELELTLRLPLDPRHGERADRQTLADLAAQLDDGIAKALRHRASWQAGHVPCRRCGTASCEHSTPTAPREVFVGWGPSGVPRFLDLAQHLLERRDPRVDQLFTAVPGSGGQAHAASQASPGRGLITLIEDAASLERQLLPAYQSTSAPKVVGQLVAGWFTATDHIGAPAAVAITLQVISSPASRGRTRFGLNLVGIDPSVDQAPTPGSGRPADRLPASRTLQTANAGSSIAPWAEVVAWGQGTLRQLERAPGAAEHVERRVLGILRAMASRLEHDRRARGRRTDHGEDRHRQGDRPTRQALADVAVATLDTTFVDLRRGTLVILGDRGRTHVFAPSGKLVTSLRTATDVVARRRERGLWRPANLAELAALRGVLNGEAPVPSASPPEANRP